MRKWILSYLLAFLLIPASYAAGTAVILTINGPIGPATQDYIIRGIEQAEKAQANFILLEMNTPGGLESAMRGINEAIIASTVPIITYVTPAGARAASAGTYILYASHLAAMAPGTNVGAATPINLLAASKDKTPSAAEKKALNDAAAYIRSVGQLRDRNLNWAEQAVREGVSISAQDAKKLNVINLLAADRTQLLNAIDGKEVSFNGTLQKISSKNLQLQFLPPDWRYRFLSFLTDPTIAYLLLLIALYGLFFEFTNPGLVLPGVAGIIALLLVLYAFQLMPINYAGLALLLVGVTFMVFEVYVASFGIIGIGGVIAFILGSVMLFDMHDPNFHLTLSAIAIMSVVTILFFFVIVTLALKSHRKAVITGQEGLIGSKGTVLNVMNEQIIVQLSGEIWEARSDHVLERGDKVKVTSIKGLILHVEPMQKKYKRKAGE